MSKPFEQEVADAIQVIHSEWWDGPRTIRLADYLAPRMTAAITAAGRVGIRSAEDGDRARVAALAALLEAKAPEHQEGR